MTILNAAVIGLGIGRQHLIGYAQTSGCTPRLACDLSSQKLTEIRVEFPEMEIQADWEAILDRDDIDLVSVASFDDVHSEQVTRLLAAGKHVFVEKPLCLDRDQLREVAKAWRASNSLWLASNLVLRSAPLYRWLKEAVEAGELGEIYAIDGDYLYGRIHKITSGWRSEVDGYSVMMGGGIHLLDLMLWLLDEAPTHVSAVGNAIGTRETSFRYPSHVSAQYRFDSGCVGRITANFGCVHRHQHVLRVFGTKATFVYDDQGPRVIRSRDPQQIAEPVRLNPLPTRKWDLIPELVKQIQQRSEPQERGQQELELVNACLAADEALHHRQELEIPKI